LTTDSRQAAGIVAAERRRLLAIEIFCLRGAQQQTRRTLLLLLSTERTDGRTDGRSTVS